LAELSPDHRAVILLREVEGRAYEEIASLLGCTLGTVMSRLFYARKKLQLLLADVYRSPDWQ
jgi:RNA polymerase sigma-70 factor (ECF subfamily)